MTPTINYLYIVLYILIPLLGSIVTYFIKSFLTRLDMLEHKMIETQTEVQVRQLIKDRYDPLAQDIRDIKEKLDKLFDLYLNQKHTDRD